MSTETQTITDLKDLRGATQPTAVQAATGLCFSFSRRIVTSRRLFALSSAISSSQAL